MLEELDKVTEVSTQISVIGLVYDTTAVNMGRNRGAVPRIEAELGESKLKMPCRRHQIELLAKRVALVVSGRPTTGPGDIVFKRFKDNWYEVQPTIDYQNLSKFD